MRKRALWNHYQPPPQALIIQLCYACNPFPPSISPTPNEPENPPFDPHSTNQPNKQINRSTPLRSDRSNPARFRTGGGVVDVRSVAFDG